MRTSNIWHLNRSSLYAVVSDISHRDPTRRLWSNFDFKIMVQSWGNVNIQSRKIEMLIFEQQQGYIRGPPTPCPNFSVTFKANSWEMSVITMGLACERRWWLMEILVGFASSCCLLSCCFFFVLISWWYCCWLVTMKVFVIYDESLIDGDNNLLCDDEGGRRLLWLAGNPKLTEGGSKRGI